MAGAKALELTSIKVVFHGGEPLMQKPRDFKRLCETLRDSLNGVCELKLGVQTNDTILSDEWLDIFQAFHIDVGVSIDGPAEYQDKYRVDRKGKGFYADIAHNIQQMQQRVAEKRLRPIGTISVMNAQFSTARVFSHLSEELGITSQGYLLPDRSYEHPFEPGETPEQYGDLLAQLFDAWVENQSISVREVSNVVNFFQLRSDELEAAAEQGRRFDIEARPTSEIVIIQSNGELSIDDSLIPATEWRKGCATRHIANTTLADLIDSPDFLELNQVRNTRPTACKPCKWVKLCGGGATENRFSKENGFDNPSVYCAGLKRYYQHVVDFLLTNDYPETLINQKLSLKG
ncbi:MAG: hypothetical protein JNM52_01775 [Betaproteobacteria bacterium]|nr:hypothetical protein [Betaproteobacteria bacterium]